MKEERQNYIPRRTYIKIIHYDIECRETSKELFRVYFEMRSKKDWTLANIQ